MKKIFFIAFLSSLVHIGACQNAANTNGTVKQNISVEEFDQKLAATPGVQLIDARTPEEYAGGHLKNAVNINYNSADLETQLAKLDKSKPVMVYCLSGGRSGKTATKMQEMGFKEVYNMDGGIMKWGSAGKPVEKGDATPAVPGMTMDAFNKMVSGDKYVLVDYNAAWCEPCKKMMPMLESLTEKRKDKMTMVKVDADANKELLKQKGISSIPYLELYKDGKLVWKHDGTIDEDRLLKETKL